MINKRWPLGFLGFFGIKGIVGLINGDYLEAVWILWFVWFLVFIPKENSYHRNLYSKPFQKPSSNIVPSSELIRPLSQEGGFLVK